jgi:hypothetical protein
MKEIKVGDRVEIPGDTQSYTLVNEKKVYMGEVIEANDDMLVVRLDKPVVRGPGKFREVTVPKASVRLTHAKKD